MRIALVSIGDPRDVKVWSGTPSFILRELRKQTSAVEVIAPLSRWFKYLFMPARILHRIRRTQIQFDRHPLALRSYARQIQRQLRGKQVDAVLSTSSVAVSLLKTRIPIFFWTDAVVEGMFDYYPGSFTGMATEERVIGHRQEQNALDDNPFLRRHPRKRSRIIIEHSLDNCIGPKEYRDLFKRDTATLEVDRTASTCFPRSCLWIWRA